MPFNGRINQGAIGYDVEDVQVAVDAFVQLGAPPKGDGTLSPKVMSHPIFNRLALVLDSFAIPFRENSNLTGRSRSEGISGSS